jgi:hypothetical protein
MSKFRHLLINAFLLGVFLPSGYTQFSFGEAIVSDCESDSREIVLVDLDEDEHLDLVVVNFSTSSITPMFSDGFGKFNCGYPIPVGLFPTDIAAGDFDGDDYPDLVVLTQEPENELVLLYGKGDGVFDDLATLDFGSPNDVTVTDFNLDDIPDIAIAEGFSTVKTLLGQENEQFLTGGTATVGDAPIVLFSADLNRDGIPDLVTGHGLSNDFSIIFGDGTGEFSEPVFYPTDGNPWDFKLADVTNDDNLDLIVAVNDEVSEVEIYKGDGMGVFTLFSTISTPFQPLGIAVADFNNNGEKDLVVSVDNLNEDNILIYQGNGAGLFIEAGQLSAMGFPGQLFAEDCNQDGLPDILVNDHRISVFLNNQVINDVKAVPAMRHFAISPNPANTDALNIRLKNVSTSKSNILIVNNLGEIIYRQQHQSTQNVTVPLADFDNGIYWVTIQNEAFVASEKLVISK